MSRFKQCQVFSRNWHSFCLLSQKTFTSNYICVQLNKSSRLLFLLLFFPSLSLSRSTSISKLTSGSVLAGLDLRADMSNQWPSPACTSSPHPLACTIMEDAQPSPSTPMEHQCTINPIWAEKNGRGTVGCQL